jgi:hypothetical protein
MDSFRHYPLRKDIYGRHFSQQAPLFCAPFALILLAFLFLLNLVMNFEYLVKYEGR